MSKILISQIEEKQFMKAMSKTLNEYEKLIENPKENIHKWEHYGYKYSCRICDVFCRSCEDCPLNSMSIQNNNINGCCTDIYNRFLDSIIYYMETGKILRIKQFATDRYYELIKHIGKLGYEYDYDED